MEGKRRRKRQEWRNYYRGGEKRGKELPFLATTQLSTTKALEMNIYLGKRNLPLYLHGHCWLHMSHEPHWSEVSVWGWRFWSIWWMPNTMPSWWCPPSALPPHPHLSAISNLSFILRRFSFQYFHVHYHGNDIIILAFLNPAEFFFIFPFSHVSKRRIKGWGGGTTHCWRQKERANMQHLTRKKALCLLVLSLDWVWQLNKLTPDGSDHMQFCLETISQSLFCR